MYVYCIYLKYDHTYCPKFLDHLVHTQVMTAERTRTMWHPVHTQVIIRRRHDQPEKKSYHMPAEARQEEDDVYSHANYPRGSDSVLGLCTNEICIGRKLNIENDDYCRILKSFRHKKNGWKETQRRKIVWKSCLHIKNILTKNCNVCFSCDDLPYQRTDPVRGSGETWTTSFRGTGKL